MTKILTYCKIVILLLMLLAGQAVRTQSISENEQLVKVLSFNIKHGSTSNGDFNLDLIAQVIKDADPDLVALQEVDFKTNRARGYDLATELGLRTNMASLFW